METYKCPHCGIGMDIHLVKKPPVIFEHFLVGVRDCPNCQYEIEVHISATRKEDEQILQTG